MRRTLSALPASAILFFMASCIDDSPKDSVVTRAASEITDTTAVSGGEVNSDGAEVISKGVCWDTLPNPTVDKNHTTDGTGTGHFVSQMTGLIEKKTYYVRAYATIRNATMYGNEVAFTTFSCGFDTVSDLDGNLYHTVTIGTQVWMVENLRTTRYRDGSRIPRVTGNEAWDILRTGAYCNYNNDGDNASTYGHLYNWHAVHDGRSLAPAGWHVATAADWSILTSYLGGFTVAGGTLKEAGTAHWESPNTGATNACGFNALPGGRRNENGPFFDLGEVGYWWSATESSTNFGWCFVLWFKNDDVNRYHYDKRYGYSVRCVKD